MIGHIPPTSRFGQYAPIPHMDIVKNNRKEQDSNPRQNLVDSWVYTNRMYLQQLRKGTTLYQGICSAE